MVASHVKYVLIGGGVASSAAAKAIRQLDPDGTLILIGQEVNRPYHRPALNKQYLRGQTGRSQLFTLPDSWFAEHHVQLCTGRRATRLDVARHAVMLDNGEEIGFERLLIATGAVPRHLAIPGAELPNVYYLRSLEDADRLRNAVDKARHEGRPHERGRGRAAVIGAGLLGLELADSLIDLGLAVDLISPRSHPWSRFIGETTGRFLTHLAESRGVKTFMQTSAVRLEGDGRVQRVVLSDGGVREVDLAIAALGTLANRDLVKGTTLAAEKAILVDDHCRTNDPAIYAAGDCAAVFDPLFGKYRPLEHWEPALECGTIAGRNMAGANARYMDVNHFASTVFGVNIACWGDARLIERRILRGNTSLESPDFLEIGVAGDGRIAQVLAVNHEGEDLTLCELVRRRLNITDRESLLRDPAIAMRSLLT